MIKRLAAVGVFVAGCGGGGVSSSHDADVSIDAEPPCAVPPGRRLVYQQRDADTGLHHLVLVDLSSGEAGCSVRLTDEPIDPYRVQWSADGSWLVFGRYGDSWTVVVDARGDVTVPTSLDGVSIASADENFSPDGRWLLIERDQEIDVVALEGDLGVSVSLGLPPGYWWQSLRWSPDGAYLGVWGTALSGPDEPALYVLDMRGDAPGVPSLAGYHGPFFEWSPDSTRLAVRPFGGTPRPVSVVDVPSFVTRPVTIDGGTDYDAALSMWSPDGTWLYVLRIALDSTEHLAAVPSRGTITASVVSPPALRSAPRWLAPRTFAYVGERAVDLAGIYAIDVGDAGPEPARLLSGSNDVWFTQWSPDGALVLGENAASGGDVLRFQRDAVSGTAGCPAGHSIRPDGTSPLAIWSPDSATYVCIDRATPDLVLVTAATGALTPLNTANGLYGDFQWSHDSAMLSLAGEPLGVYDTATGQLRFVDDDGTEPHWAPAGAR